MANATYICCSSIDNKNKLHFRKRRKICTLQRVLLYLDSQKLNRPVLITLITSLTIELVQMFIGRSFDIDDILLNCVGGICGFLLFIGLSAIKRHLPKFLQRDLVYNILTVILIIIIIIYIFRFWGVKI